MVVGGEAPDGPADVGGASVGVVGNAGAVAVAEAGFGLPLVDLLVGGKSPDGPADKGEPAVRVLGVGLVVVVVSLGCLGGLPLVAGKSPDGAADVGGASVRVVGDAGAVADIAAVAAVAVAGEGAGNQGGEELKLGEEKAPGWVGEWVGGRGYLQLP